MHPKLKDHLKKMIEGGAMRKPLTDVMHKPMEEEHDSAAERYEETGELPPATDVNGHPADSIPEHLHHHVKSLVKELHSALNGQHQDDKMMEDLEVQR